jgi:hypothetical protein
MGSADDASGAPINAPALRPAAGRGSHEYELPSVSSSPRDDAVRPLPASLRVEKLEPPKKLSSTSPIAWSSLPPAAALTSPLLCIAVGTVPTPLSRRERRWTLAHIMRVRRGASYSNYTNRTFARVFVGGYMCNGRYIL